MGGKEEFYEQLPAFKRMQFNLTLFSCKMRIKIPALCGYLVNRPGVPALLLDSWGTWTSPQTSVNKPL